MLPIFFDTKIERFVRMLMIHKKTFLLSGTFIEYFSVKWSVICKFDIKGIKRRVEYLGV